MTVSPASGERRAVRGYRWQYDHVAALVYDALIQDDFVSLRLVDPEAGQVDDLVLETRSGVDGYQFKSAESDGFLTFSQFLSCRRTRSGGPAPSFIRALADGWKLLRSQHYGLPVRVHLVTRLFASPHEHLTGPTGRISPDHFQAFIECVLKPLRQGTLTAAEVPIAWAPAMAKLQAGADLPAEQFPLFAQAMHLDFGVRDALPTADSVRRNDIKDLSHELFRTVSNASAVVRLDRQQVLNLMGWADRPLLRSTHDFPVDLDTYVPLEDAMAELDLQLSRNTSGYIALIGPPGAGKSTLLNQALTGSSERIVRYYAYVPQTAATRNRLTAQAFLHDLVVMLGRAGLTTADRHLASSDRQQLRAVLHEQLDAASNEFSQSGRRTIIVIDGLDHVERDYPGNDGLLAELPTLSEIPDGVLIIAGSRTLRPLHPQTRQWIEDSCTTVNLEHHRLSTLDVMRICRRFPVTSALGGEVHHRIAQLSSGHPLALSYLLNRFRTLRKGGDPQEILAKAPVYADDIAAEYRVVWDSIEAETAVFSMLAVCARLRIGFTIKWLRTWASPAALAILRRDLFYLFRRHHDGWHFFHDSFRQFAVDRTAGDDGDHFDQENDAALHANVADLCSASTDRLVRWEEIYHRHCAGQREAVMRLGEPDLFREQACSLRSPEMIRMDIALALRAYAARCDVRGMLAMILASRELSCRTVVFGEVDIPSLFYDIGLIDEAIAVCGGDTGRRVPLPYAYRLAERLGRDRHPEGRRIFDLIEHDGFNDPDYPYKPNLNDDAAEAWGAAVPWFRPLGAILAAAAALTAPNNGEGYRDRVSQLACYKRYTAVMRGVTSTLADQGRTHDLLAADAALADSLHTLLTQKPHGKIAAVVDEIKGEPTEWAGQAAFLAALRVRVRIILMTMTSNYADVWRHANQAIFLLRDVPHFHSTTLDVAELAAECHRYSAASELIRKIPHSGMLTVDDLLHTGEPAVLGKYFRYWRLRTLLAHRSGNSPSEEISAEPPPSQPQTEILTLNGAFPIRDDAEAIEIARQIDSCVRTLAFHKTAIADQTAPLIAEVWASLLDVLEVFRPPSQQPHGLGLSLIFRQQKEPLLLLAVSVAAHHGAGLPERFAGTLATHFEDHPEDWPLSLRRKLAIELRRAGVMAAWYPDLLKELERESSLQSAGTRLDKLAGLIRYHAEDGDLTQAIRLARTLVPAAFGVGLGREYELISWVHWLGGALQETPSTQMISEAIWLARLLAAVAPITGCMDEGEAASALPAAVVVASPVTAVRLHEFLVRHGAAHEMKSLAGLVRELTTQQDAHSIQLAEEFTAEIITSGNDQAYPDLAAQPIDATERALGDASAEVLLRRVGAWIDQHAPPHGRPTWRQGLGLQQGDRAESASSPMSYLEDYGSLHLKDGRRIEQADVSALASDVPSLVALRQLEAPESTFDWSWLIQRMPLSSQELTTLEETFHVSSRNGTDTLTVLAEKACTDGDLTRATRLADLVLRHEPEDTWSSYWKSTRRRAHVVAAVAGGPKRKLAACQDLTQHIIANWRLASIPADELAEMIRQLDPAVTASTSWPVARRYLDGIADTQVLPQDDGLESLARRWHSSGLHPDQRDTATAALAELAVGYLAHPTQAIKLAARRLVTRALESGNAEIAEALVRFAPPGTGNSDPP